LIFFRMLSLCCFGSPPRRLKRRPRGSKTPPRAPQEAPSGTQERPRRSQEAPKRPQEPVTRDQDPPRSPLEAPQGTEDTEIVEIAEMDKHTKALPQVAEKKRRAGGGEPLGASQSAARPGGASRACRTYRPQSNITAAGAVDRELQILI
jgi:hypothetical protein